MVFPQTLNIGNKPTNNNESHYPITLINLPCSQNEDYVKLCGNKLTPLMCRSTKDLGTSVSLSLRRITLLLCPSGWRFAFSPCRFVLITSSGAYIFRHKKTAPAGAVLFALLMTISHQDQRLLFRPCPHVWVSVR